MGETFIKEMGEIFTAIIVVAIVAALVSKNAKTAQVIQAAGAFFTNVFAAILKPVS